MTFRSRRNPLRSTPWFRYVISTISASLCFNITCSSTTRNRKPFLVRSHSFTIRGIPTKNHNISFSIILSITQHSSLVFSFINKWLVKNYLRLYNSSVDLIVLLRLKNKTSTTLTPPPPLRRCVVLVCYEIRLVFGSIHKGEGGGGEKENCN